MKNFKNSQLIMLGIIVILIAIFMLMFNYFLDKKKTVYNKMSLRLFETEQSEVIINPEQDIKENSEEVIQNNELEEIENPKPDNNTKISYDYIGIIEIPKINLKRGFVDINSKYNSIKYNITVVNTSNYPDVENGNLILSAHAGNAYNSFFGKLHKLVNGDKVYIYYNGIKYEYKVVNMYEIEKTGYANIYRDFNKTTLTLITCKDNSDTLQIVYIAELSKKTKY